jgi:hypothetical protein
MGGSITENIPPPARMRPILQTKEARTELEIQAKALRSNRHWAGELWAETWTASKWKEWILLERVTSNFQESSGPLTARVFRDVWGRLN